MPAWDDLDDFLDTEDFGVWAIVSLQAGGTRRVAVLFDDPAAGLRFRHRTPVVAHASRLGSYEQDADEPSMMGKESDLAGITRRDTVVIEQKDARGRITRTTYGALTGPQPDGNGMATIALAPEAD